MGRVAQYQHLLTNFKRYTANRAYSLRKSNLSKRKRLHQCVMNHPIRHEFLHPVVADISEGTKAAFEHLGEMFATTPATAGTYDYRERGILANHRETSKPVIE